MPASTEVLARIAEHQSVIRQHANGSSQVSEPAIGYHVGKKAVAALKAGEIDLADVWKIACSHLRHVAPHADGRLEGYLAAFAEATAPTVTFVREA